MASSDTSTVAHVSMPQTISQGFRRANDKNMPKIYDSCKDNVELQILVLDTISEYQAQKEGASSMGISVSERAVEATRGKKRSQPDADAEPALVIDPTTRFRYGQQRYAQWVSKLLQEVLVYIDSDVFTKDFVKNLPRETMLQCLEKGCDVRCFGEQSDLVGTEFKLALFNNLEATYDQLGKRWRELVWSGYTVDWKMPENGHFSTQVNVDGTIMVKCKVRWGILELRVVAK